MTNKSLILNEVLKVKKMDNKVDSIAECILTEKIQKHSFFTDSECIEILVDAYLTKHSKDDDINFLISFSRGYIYSFKKKTRFCISHLSFETKTFNNKCVYKLLY